MEEASILDFLELLNNKSLAFLYIDYYFKLISPLEFEKKITNHPDLQQVDPSNKQIELLFIDYNDLRGVDRSKQIVIECFGGINKFHKESVIYIAESFERNLLNLLDASRILAEIADSETIDISIEFVGYYSEFCRLGTIPDYVNRFKNLLRETSNRLKISKK